MTLLRKNDNEQLNIVNNMNPKETSTIVQRSRETFTNRIPVDYSLYQDTYKQLLQYVSGYQVVVDYYRKLDAYVNKQTNEATSISSFGDILTKAYDRIQNLIIKLESPLNINVDPNTTEYNVTSTGTMFPGTDPMIGDIFIMDIGNQQEGIFVIDTVTPLSFHNNTIYTIEFHLYRIVTTEFMSLLQSVVIDTYIFDTEQYFTKDFAILKQEEYLTIQNIDKTISSICNYILDNNYHKTLKTMYRVDINENVKYIRYDPFITEVFNMLSNTHISPIQYFTVYCDMYFKKSIWNKILQYTNTISKVEYKYENIFVYHPKEFDIQLNPLLHKELILLVSDVYDIDYDDYYKYRYISNTNVIENSDLALYLFTEDFYKFINNEPYNEASLLNIEKLLISILTQNQLDSPTIDNLNNLLQLPYIDTENINEVYYYLLSLFILKKYKQRLI